MNSPSRIFLFAAGLVLGVIGAVVLPGQVRPYLPGWVLGDGPVARGTVMAKQKKGHALLLTVNTAEGALTATFTKKADEIGLLVNEKDVIEFTLPKYAPLIEDPRIVRIVKDQQAAPAAAPAPAPGSAGGKAPPDRK